MKGKHLAYLGIAPPGKAKKEIVNSFHLFKGEMVYFFKIFSAYFF
jgi:hypothetical protein